MAEMTGGQALAKSLYREGVRVIFGLPGAQLYYATDALFDEPGIRWISTRNEQATTFMADGYARAGGGIGTAMVVPGPGVLNATSGLSTAYSASSPVLLVAGQIPRDLIGVNRGMLHEIDDQLEAVKSVTKWAARVVNAGDVPSAVHEAFRQLNTGRPRPVEVEIPPDTLAEALDIELLEPAMHSPTDPPCGPDCGGGAAAGGVRWQGGYLGRRRRRLGRGVGGVDAVGRVPASARFITTSRGQRRHLRPALPLAGVASRRGRRHDAAGGRRAARRAGGGHASWRRRTCRRGIASCRSTSTLMRLAATTRTAPCPCWETPRCRWSGCTGRSRGWSGRARVDRRSSRTFRARAATTPAEPHGTAGVVHAGHPRRAA